MNIEQFLTHFNVVGRCGAGWKAICPVHDDTNASVVISVGTNGGIVMHCHAGCSNESIVNSIGLKMADLAPEDGYKKQINKIQTPERPPKPSSQLISSPPKLYQGKSRKETEFKYIRDGIHRYSQIRIDVPGKEKTFSIQRIENGRRVPGLGDTETFLYNFDNNKRAIVNEETIFICEGEKCCDRLTDAGLNATTNLGGAKKWKDSYTESLYFSNIVILPDNDGAGQEHAKKLKTELLPVVKSLKIIDLPGLPTKGDVVDWLDGGGTAERLLEIVDSAPTIEKEADKPEPVFYYDKDKKEYLMQNKRCWLSLNEGQFKKYLQSIGYNPKTYKGERISDVDTKIIELRDSNDIDFSGSLAGHQKGYYEVFGKRLLITEGPVIIYPKRVDYSMLYGIIYRLFVGEDEDETPLHHFFGWLKIAYESLVNKTFRPGQILVLAGEAECGKSLLQKIITIILGGRSASPYNWMMGKTDFNSDMFGAEHLTIEDEVASTDIRSRREFGGKLKQLSANEEIKCSAKYRNSLVLHPFWRMSISLNDEPENLMILPPLDDSISGKMIILHAYRKAMPMPTAKTNERSMFWEKLKTEISGLLHFLTEYKIPEDLISERYGIKEYCDQYIRHELEVLSPENRLLELIDMCLFNDESFALANEYILTSHEIELKLLENASTKFEAQKVLSWSNACGTYLGRLARKYPYRMGQDRTSDKRKWIIRKG
jgi:hypothetical protein